MDATTAITTMVVSLITVFIGLLVLITFFVMASRLLAIKNTLKSLLDLEIMKPTNKFIVKCKKCSKEYPVSNLKKGQYTTCPECEETN